MWLPVTKFEKLYTERSQGCLFIGQVDPMFHNCREKQNFSDSTL